MENNRRFRFDVRVAAATTRRGAVDATLRSIVNCGVFQIGRKEEDVEIEDGHINNSAQIVLPRH